MLDTANLTLPQVLAIFVGIPAAILLAIALAVFGPRRWRPRGSRKDVNGGSAVSSSAQPHGIARRDSTCWVPTGPDADGDVDLHYQSPTECATGTTRQLDDPCWTVQCTGCGDTYRHGEDEVHFLTPRQAWTSAWTRGWTVATNRLRCPMCSTVLGRPDAPPTQ